MFEAKRLYYQKEGKISKARIMNQKLEKKDADVFLDIISARFMGVYVVDMKNNHARAIYKPSYFLYNLDV